MYGNQVLKKLNLTTVRLEWRNKDYNKQFIKSLQTIKEAPHFYMGHYGDFEESVAKRLGGKNLFMGDISNVKLPYPEVVLFFSSQSDQVKYGMIVRRFKGRKDTIIMEYLVSTDNYWWLLPIERIYIFNQSLADSGVLDLMKQETKVYAENYNAVIKGNTALRPNVDIRKPENKFLTEKALVDIQITLSAVFNYFLLLLKYRNIVVETVYRNKPKIGRKRKINRLFDYKVLKVRPFGKSKKYVYDDKDKNSKGLVPFHPVMGYEKTYTEDAPMFGNPKLVGTYWVPEHFRGNKQSGFISRDYEIDTKNDCV